MADRKSRRKKREELVAPKGAGLEERIVEKYARTGMQLISDDVPKHLDPLIRKEIESVTGMKLQDVRIHTGERAQRMAEHVGARAFAAGEADLFFGRGEYNPATPEGKALLAHELTHVAEGHIGLSGKQPSKPERERLEMRARRSEELILAKEDMDRAVKPDEMQEPVAVELPPRGDQKATSDSKPKVMVDKALLEAKIYEVIEREMKRERDRIGR